MRNRHEPRRAWLIGRIYFVTCWVIAGVSGALALVADQSIVTVAQSRQPGFWILTGITAAAASIGYWIVWPKGTHTGGRPRRRLPSAVFGLTYGASEGLLYLAVWLIVSRVLGRSPATILVLFIAIAAFNVVWRRIVWDVWVMPAHNIEEWDLRKVLWVHAPVLLLVLSHVTVYQRGLLFVGFEIIALLGSTVHVRFPAPTSPRSSTIHRPRGSTA